MRSCQEDVFVFGFTDSSRTAAVLTFLTSVPGVRPVCALGRTADGEVQLLPREDGPAVEGLPAVISAVGVALAALNDQPGHTAAVDRPPLLLPAHRDGLHAFSALVRPGHQVFVVAACDETAPAGDELARWLRATVGGTAPGHPGRTPGPPGQEVRRPTGTRGTRALRCV